ncbi:NADH:flavin oxidoreductase [Streptomyces spongiae]|uniref:NADH:flavin oxidoreductase n=1 Tax=Streptomyces spongiae TaxID=565072 RepID=A0A5N8XAL1_9ACTN|nr:NADH:flavin oxidoreductase [Streptomyces spongiae]MPY56186.1 NADH:flavin oxidoreductase [Streptomyces spongiae]
MGAATRAGNRPGLDAPVRIGPLTARNPVFFAPTSVGYADQGVLGDAAVAHYVRRATGGVGAVMTEQIAVAESGWQHARQPGAWHDRHDEGLRRLATGIKEAGALAIAQLSHCGRYAGPWARYAERRRLAPSAVPFLLPVGEVCPDEITPDEIGEVIEDFAAATRRVVAAGFDGIEIHGGSGFLLTGFLSPRTNRRTDAWADGTRFVLDVVRACRTAAGTDTAVGYHIMTDELLPGGYSLEQALALVPRLERAGVDFFRPAAGTFESLKAPQNAGLSAGPDYQRADTHALAEVANVPVLAGGGISTLDQVREVLDAGAATAVAMARPLLADPDWLLKARDGAPPVGCACAPSLCLQTQLTGSVCAAWPEETRGLGHSGQLPPYRPRQETT